MLTERMRIKTENNTIDNRDNKPKSISSLKKETEHLRQLKKSRLKTEIEASRLQLEILDLEIIKHHEQEADRKRNNIENRIQDILRKQNHREMIIKRSDQSVRKIKMLQQLQELRYQKRLLQFEQSKREQEQKILRQKRKLLEPIKFAEIKAHAMEYDERLKQMRSVKMNMSTRNNTSMQIYSPPKSTTQAAKRVREEYEAFKNKQKLQKEQVKQLQQKRFEYGDEAEQKYKHVSAKLRTQPVVNITQSDQIYNYRQELKKREKQRYKFIEGDAVVEAGKEIDKIKNGSMHYFDKFEVLNNLSKGYVERFSNGKSRAIELAAQANIALADLLSKQLDEDQET